MDVNATLPAFEFRSDPMQRLMRDLYAVSAHRALTRDVCTSGYGAALLRGRD